MNLAWLTDPMQLLLAALVAFRLTRLVVDDTLPPLPRLRAWVEQRGSLRREQQVREAMLADAEDPDHQQKAEESVRRAREGGYNSTRLVGPREHAVNERHRPYPDPSLLVLITCYWCAGFWVSLIVAAGATFLSPTIAACVAAPFALSALVGLAARLTA